MLTEPLTWHPATQPPDADTTVLLWLPEDGLDPDDWCAGWWDGEEWLECVDGMPIERPVSHWALPQGPEAA